MHKFYFTRSVTFKRSDTFTRTDTSTLKPNQKSTTLKQVKKLFLHLLKKKV